jgi:hypothetical protein
LAAPAFLALSVTVLQLAMAAENQSASPNDIFYHIAVVASRSEIADPPLMTRYSS